MALLTDRKFIHFNRKSDFEALLNANAISDKQIVFLKDAQEIWTHGTYYGSVEQFLDETNKDSTNAVSAAAVYKALADDEKVIAAALNDLNDKYTNLDSSKQDVISDLDTIRENAQSGASKVSNVQADWNATSGLAQILHKPDLSVYENKVTSVNGQTGDVEVVVPQSLLLKGITPQGHTLADAADSYYANELNNGEAGAWFISYSNGNILVKSNDTSKDQDGRVCLSSTWKSRLNYGGMTWANVGDILLVYKQSSLIVVYKVMSINEAGETRIGLMSPNDKIQVNKISNIEGNVNNLLGKIDKRLPYSTDSTNIGNAGNGAYTNVTAGRTNWLDTSTAGAAIKLGNLQIAIDNSGRLYSRNQTNNIWNVTNQLKTITETDLNNVFEPSVIGYTTVTNGPSETGNYTVYTFTSSDYDGNGFRSILQIAINRNSGNQYMRTCFKKVDGSGTDFTSTDWKLVSPSVTSVNGQTGEVTITETQLSKGTATGTGNAVTDINVSNHQITLVKGATYATQSDIDTSIANLVDSAPETLDTLNELAAALGDDPNFATTVANQIGQKYTKPNTGIPASDLAAGVIPAAPGTLNTTATTAQTTSSSEALSGSITLHKVAKTGTYNDLIGKPTIPAAVTESTISGWGFTKNTGTYSKPSGGIPKTDLASAVQTSLGKADSAIQGVKVNGTALTPDANKVVDVTVPTNVSDLTNDLNFVRRYHLLGLSVLLLTDSGEWAENSELNTPTVVFKFNQTEDNILLGEFYPTFMYCKLPKAANIDFYPNTILGLTSYITINLGEPLGYYNGNNAKPYWRTGWDVVPTVSLAFDNGSGSINTVPGINMTFVGVLDRGAIGQGTHYITICYNSIYRNYKFELLIFYDLELQRLHLTKPFVLTISDLGEVNTIETIKVNNTTLTPDSNKVVNITIPEGELSNNYEPSSSDNEDLELAAGDTYEEAFGKLEKSINDNEQITAAALTDLDSRINTLHLPQSLDDIPDGSTRKLSDYATTTLLATKQDALVSGTNIKTINNESLLGSGNITIQGGSGGDTNVIETVKVNGTALTPDSNKAVNITSVPASIVTQDATHRFVSDTEKTTWNGKQNALQHYSESNGVDISTYVSEGDINIISYDDNGVWPVGGATFGSNGIELNAKQSYTGNNDEIEHTVTLNYEGFKYDNKLVATVDQIPSAVTESTVSGWGFTKNAGTITGITMNGASKGTSGVVDLGTVLTSETDPTVPAWAKASTKPTYTAQEVGALPNTYTPPVTSVNGQTGAVNLTIPSAPGTLNTTATTAQSTSSSEALSGNITLHKVAKTGTYGDLIGAKTKLSEFTNDSSYIANNTFYNTITLRSTTTTLNSEDIILQTGANKIELNPTGLTYRDTKHFLFDDAVITTDIEGGVDAHWSTLSDSQLLSAAVIKTKLDELPTVNNATLTIQKNGTTVNTFTANASSNVTANIQVNELPTVSSSDNGKILMVVNGAWSLVTPTAIYSGTSAPDSNTGNNGDIYLQTS